MRSNVILFAGFAAFSPMLALAGETQSATLAIQGMTCAACPVTIGKLLKSKAGVAEVSVDGKAHLALVKFDPDRVQPEQLAKAVSEIGFPATVKK